MQSNRTEDVSYPLLRCSLNSRALLMISVIYRCAERETSRILGLRPLYGNVTILGPKHRIPMSVECTLWPHPESTVKEDLPQIYDGRELVKACDKLNQGLLFRTCGSTHFQLRTNNLLKTRMTERMSWPLLLLDFLLLVENISSKMNWEGIVLLQSVLFSEDNLEFSRLSKGRLDHSLYSVLSNNFQSNKLGITSISRKDGKWEYCSFLQVEHSLLYRED